MIAEVRPSLSAVKKLEPNIAYPINRNETANILKPAIVIFIRSVSYHTKSFASGTDKSSPEITIQMAKAPIIITLLFSNPLSSEWFFAPK